MARDISLSEAVGEIRRTVKVQGKSPFFFIVGAGISHPIVPLAEGIVQDCKKLKPGEEPKNKSALERYSYWLAHAYPGADSRRKYFNEMVWGKPISEANLRLAHLLGCSLAKIVVTPNFDDFLSRALHLFGQHHLVCDHPQTAARVNLEEDEIQILHVHGTYKFYDLANLQEEVRLRAASAPGLSMSGLLDALLRQHSPLVVGYSGWADDVIMTALKRRLKSELPNNLYWFCYRHEDRDQLPEWLKRHRDVRFVLPEPAAAGTIKLTADSEKMDAGVINQYLAAEPNLPATKVFERLIEAFEVQTPALLQDPLGHLVQRLKESFPVPQSSIDSDPYALRSIVVRVSRARDWLLEVSLEEFERRMEALRNAVRRANYLEAVNAASKLRPDDFQDRPEEAKEYLSALRAAARALDKPEERLRAWNKIIEVADSLVKHYQRDNAVEIHLAWALCEKGETLQHLGRSKEAFDAYDKVMRHFGEATEADVREAVAKALVYKGVTLIQLGRLEEAIAVYDEVVRRFGEASELGLRKAVAQAMVDKGTALSQIGQPDEELAMYDGVVRRLGEASEVGLRKVVAVALVNKGVTLKRMGRPEEAIAVYDELLRRCGDDSEPGLREAVARALVNKGGALGQMDRSEEEIKVYEEVMRRFGEATQPSLRYQVAKALCDRGLRLWSMNRLEEAIAVYDELVRRFGEASEPGLREAVAKALFEKGVTLTKMGRCEEKIAVQDEVLRRFGDASEPRLQEAVAWALISKGVTLCQIGRPEEGIALFDELVQRFGEAIEPELREDVALALFLKGIALRGMERPEQEIAVYDDVVKRFGEATEPRLRRRVAEVLFQKGVTLSRMGRPEEEIAAYEEIVRHFGKATEAYARKAVAEALVYKAVVLDLIFRHEEAIAVYDELLRRFGEDSEIDLREQMAGALFSKAVALGRMGRSEQEIGVYDEVVRRFDAASEPNLREWVARALLNKGISLGQMGRPKEAMAVFDEVVQRFGGASEPSLRDVASLAAYHAAEILTRRAKRIWREGNEGRGRHVLSRAMERLSLAPAAGDAKRLALAGYIAFLLSSEEAEAKAHISEALRLNAEEARGYLLDLAQYQPLPRDKKLKSWLKTLEGR
jgi:tetratricopeptide (TPR) repeat protein